MIRAMRAESFTGYGALKLVEIPNKLNSLKGEIHYATSY
jgi:hypothetical protein